jgi:hypothetical protein
MDNSVADMCNWLPHRARKASIKDTAKHDKASKGERAATKEAAKTDRAAALEAGRKKKAGIQVGQDKASHSTAVCADSR